MDNPTHPHLDVSDVTIPDDFVDVSWKNDVCPSLAPNGDDRVRLWVDGKDPDGREFRGAPRFTVTVDGEDDPIYSGDDFTQAVQIARKAYANLTGS